MSDSIHQKIEHDPDETAELIRKKYLYRRLIMKKKTSLSHGSAARLIGPDSAYHLYRHISGNARPPLPSESRE